MTMRPKGGVGSNQYRTRGVSKVAIAPTIEVDQQVQDRYLKDKYGLLDRPGWPAVPSVEVDKLIRSKRCPPRLWQLAIDSGSCSWMVSVAKCRYAPTEIYEQLVGMLPRDLSDGGVDHWAINMQAQWQAWEAMLRSLASNQAVPPIVFRKLSKCQDIEVRRCLARNPKCPGPILMKLAGDPDRFVRRALLGNPSIPDHIKVIGVLGFD